MLHSNCSPASRLGDAPNMKNGVAVPKYFTWPASGRGPRVSDRPLDVLTSPPRLQLAPGFLLHGLWPFAVGGVTPNIDTASFCAALLPGGSSACTLTLISQSSARSS